MTEDEARQKWCPFVDNSHLVNRKHRGPEWRDNDVNCIASDCMMWREREYWDNNDPSDLHKEGYCGLAR